MMKIQYLFAVALVGVVLSGCAKDREAMVQTTDQTQKRVHTQDELRKTGQTETGAALEKVDPAVQISGQR